MSPNPDPRLPVRVLVVAAQVDSHCLGGFDPVGLRLAGAAVAPYGDAPCMLSDLRFSVDEGTLAGCFGNLSASFPVRPPSELGCASLMVTGPLLPLRNYDQV